jgi:hypothetical protein
MSCHYDQTHCAERRVFLIVMLSVIMLSAIIMRAVAPPSVVITERSKPASLTAKPVIEEFNKFELSCLHLNDELEHF